jgi:hypothetical protein
MRVAGSSVSLKVSFPSSLYLSFSSYARSCQDQWPEPRVYDDVPYEKMQVQSTGAMNMAKTTLLSLSFPSWPLVLVSN